MSLYDFALIIVNTLHCVHGLVNYRRTKLSNETITSVCTSVLYVYKFILCTCVTSLYRIRDNFQFCFHKSQSCERYNIFRV